MPENTASIPKTHRHSGDSNQTPGLCSHPQPCVQVQLRTWNSLTM